MLIPRCSKRFFNSLEIVALSFISNRSKNSMIVTLTPKLFNKEAHSTPITPPPIIAIDSGSSSNSSIPSEDKINSSSSGKLGNVLGLEPVAIMTFLGTIISSSRVGSLNVTATAPETGEKMEGPKIAPSPAKILILFFLHKPSTPLCNCSIIPSFRCCILEKSMDAASVSIPKEAACFKVSKTSALLNKAFVGIQPLCKQVPPNLYFSTIVTFSPFCAARIAAT